MLLKREEELTTALEEEAASRQREHREHHHTTRQVYGPDRRDTVKESSGHRVHKLREVSGLPAGSPRRAVRDASRCRECRICLVGRLQGKPGLPFWGCQLSVKIPTVCGTVSTMRGATTPTGTRRAPCCG